MNEALECPVDQVTINENKARVIAFIVLFITAAYFLTGRLYLIVFLAVDFGLRTTRWAKGSPISLLADIIISQFNIKNKPTDRAPKRFAAGTGLLFTVLIGAAALLHFDIVSIVLAVILIFFAGLESLVGFCAGCHVYSFLKTIGLLSGK